MFDPGDAPEWAVVRVAHRWMAVKWVVFGMLLAVMWEGWFLPGAVLLPVLLWVQGQQMTRWGWLAGRRAAGQPAASGAGDAE